MTAGRPMKFKTARQMQKAIERYFDECEKTGTNVKLTALARYLKLTPQSLLNYGERDEFYETIMDARLRIEEAYEERLIERGNGGDIFALKQFGWSDKTEHQIDMSSKTSLEMKLKNLEGEKY